MAQRYPAYYLQAVTKGKGWSSSRRGIRHESFEGKDSMFTTSMSKAIQAARELSARDGGEYRVRYDSFEAEAMRQHFPKWEQPS